MVVTNPKRHQSLLKYNYCVLLSNKKCPIDIVKIYVSTILDSMYAIEHIIRAALAQYQTPDAEFIIDRVKDVPEGINAYGIEYLLGAIADTDFLVKA